MRFSLVVATIGRADELKRLLVSLVGQTHQDFEIIIVDQNSDDRVVRVVEEFSDALRIKRLSAPPGVSRARNFGLTQASGEIVGFPDDDCWYPPETLNRVSHLFSDHHEWEALIGDFIDEQGGAVLPWPERSRRATKAVSWRRAVTFACFVRAATLEKVGNFDETLGPGSGHPWGCGEDNDLMLRIIEAGCHVRYEVSVKIKHPRMFWGFDETSVAKRYRYSVGDGHLLRMHPMPLWWRFLFFAVPLGRMAVAALKLGKAEPRFHWVTFTGRVEGSRSRSEL